MRQHLWKRRRCLDKGLSSIPRRCSRGSYETPWLPEDFSTHQPVGSICISLNSERVVN